MLTPDRIKPFLLDDDPDVRRFVVDYFAQSWSDDPELLPMVLDACGRFGFGFEAGSNLFDAARFPVTGPALDRVLGLLGRVEDESAIRHLNRIVAAAPAGLLRDRAEAIGSCPNILPETRPRLAARREYLDWPAERLWAELQAFARRSEDQDIATDVDLDYAADLVDALGDRDVPDAQTIVRMMVELEPEEGWLEIFLVDLAGRRRLREAIPALVGKLDIDSDYLLEQASEALARIGDVEAVRLIRRDFPAASDDFRNYASGVLGHIKHPESEAAALEILEGERDESIRMWLCMALCDLFSERGFEAVRREMKSASPMVFRELCAPALAVIKVLGLDPPPEAEGWERERRRQGEAIRLAMAEMEGLDGRGLGESEDDFLGLEDDDFLDEPRRDAASTIRNVGPKVGRNDPCPCGSGKKFKKCCGRSG